MIKLTKLPKLGRVIDSDIKTIGCEECGWIVNVSHLTKAQAFQEAQDHEDIEHEGARIEWHTIN